MDERNLTSLSIDYMSVLPKHIDFQKTIHCWYCFWCLTGMLPSHQTVVAAEDTVRSLKEAE